MNLLRAIRSFLSGDWLPGGETPPALRNKPGGMAYINPVIDEGDGASVLIGRVVQTVRVEGGMWLIDPPQVYTITHAARNLPSGLRVRPGDTVASVSIADEALTPLRYPGHDERDESAQWLPPVPSQLIPLRVKGEVKA